MGFPKLSNKYHPEIPRPSFYSQLDLVHSNLWLIVSVSSYMYLQCHEMDQALRGMPQWGTKPPGPLPWYEFYLITEPNIWWSFVLLDGPKSKGPFTWFILMLVAALVKSRGPFPWIFLSHLLGIPQLMADLQCWWGPKSLGPLPWIFPCQLT